MIQKSLMNMGDFFFYTGGFDMDKARPETVLST